jgi:peptide/nickel transport system ATP-binding protein
MREKQSPDYAPCRAPLLELQNLSVAVRRGRDLFTALEGVGFRINRGEILGLVGESGCGKSLSALSIPGLLSPELVITGGSIVFEGRELRNLPETELRSLRGKEISMIFQEPLSSLNPLLKIETQIAEALELHGERDRKKIRLRVLELMEELGLPEPEKLGGAYPHELSGGMCQRVMIAAAAICGPRLLIADEPTTALDPDIQTQILDLLKKINRDFGTAILFISHDLSLVRSFCGRILVMYAGRIIERGPAEKIFSCPAHPYTRALIGAIPGRGRKGKPLANIPGRVPPLEEPRRGCPFAPRCAYREAACAAAFPEPADLGGGHRVHCLRNMLP